MDKDLFADIVITDDEEVNEVVMEVEAVFDEIMEEPELVMEAKPKKASPAKKAPTGIAGLITSIQDSVEYLTWVIYGKNGTGKTTILSTADNVLILAAEDGTLSIKDKAKTAMKLKIDTWEKLEEVYWLLHGGKRSKKGITIPTAEGDFLVQYLAIDTVTKLAEVCMRNVVLGDSENDTSRDVLKRTIKDWGDMNEKMKYWLQRFEELPLQRVWVAQESSNTDDIDSEEFSIFPALNKGLRSYVLSEADIIARTYIARHPELGLQYRLTAVPHANAVTKDRTGKLNKAPMNNPSLSKMYDLVFNTKEEK